MLFLGPESWVRLMKRETANLHLPNNSLAVNLNPALEFSARLAATLEIYPSVDRLYISSASSREKLTQDSRLYLLLLHDNVSLVSGHRHSLLELLRSDFSPRS